MDFLESAIFSEQDSSMLGARLVNFDLDDTTSRAKVNVYDVNELRSLYLSMNPVGFILDEDGALMADTNARVDMAPYLFDQMVEEFRIEKKKKLDLTDFLLRGLEHHSYVVVNYSTMQENEEKGIVIPFSSFKVSNSSFNIYASYMNEDGYYRTFSLLHLEDGTAEPFYAALLEEVDVSDFDEVSKVGTQFIEGREYNIYYVNLGLSVFTSGVGEAFLNNLAWHIGFYNIGEDVLKNMMELVHPSVKVIMPPEDRVEKERRYPKFNVSIVSCLKDSMFAEFTKACSDPNELQRFVNTYPSGRVTYQWVQYLKQSPWLTDLKEGDDVNQATFTACINILADCRSLRLKYALELLTHRYYIYSQGFVNDKYQPILKGGGVNDGAIKQFVVRNR